MFCVFFFLSSSPLLLVKLELCPNCILVHLFGYICSFIFGGWDYAMHHTGEVINMY